LADRREELIREGFDAWERGDTEATLALYDPEIVVYAPPEIGNPGTFHGIEGFLEWAAAWYEAWETFEQEVVRIEPVGATHGVADTLQKGRGRGSGIEIERQASWVYDVRDEKLVYMALYWDREKAVAAAREREAQAAD
jgi:ketosteroid isomerase-like protein